MDERGRTGDKAFEKEEEKEVRWLCMHYRSGRWGNMVLTVWYCGIIDGLGAWGMAKWRIACFGGVSDAPLDGAGLQ